MRNRTRASFPAVRPEGPQAQALAFIAALAVAAPSAALAAAERVTIELPVPARINTSGFKTVLVTKVVAPDHPGMDVNREFVRWVRREIAQSSSLKVLDVEPPALPEQPIEDLVQNYVFWKRLGERFGADLIVSGFVSFTTSDRSGFVQEDLISPVTGQKVRMTRFAEREEFSLQVNIWFFQGLNGAMLYEDTFRGRQVHEGKANDPLQIFYDLAERMVPDLSGVIAPQRRKESRTIFDQ